MAKKSPADIQRRREAEQARENLRREHVENAKPKALFVEMAPSDIVRFKKLAKELNISMRELVARALAELEQRWLDATANSRPMEGHGIAFDERAMPGMREHPAAEDAALEGKARLFELEARIAKAEAGIEQMRNHHPVAGVMRTVVRRRAWSHSHNASLNGQRIELHSEPFSMRIPNGPIIYCQLLYERDSDVPSWVMMSDGAIRYIAAPFATEHGIIVKAA